MRTLSDHLSNYAAYHQDGRNIATHFVGIPAIVLAVAILLSRHVFAELAGVAVTPAQSLRERIRLVAECFRHVNDALLGVFGDVGCHGGVA